jgi:hypothetical protein
MEWAATNSIDSEFYHLIAKGRVGDYGGKYETSGYEEAEFIFSVIGPTNIVFCYDIEDDLKVMFFYRDLSCSLYYSVGFWKSPTLSSRKSQVSYKYCLSMFSSVDYF